MKRFNQAEWIGFILLSGLALYLAYLLRNGSIISFIHPKRIPLMWASLGGLILLVIYQSTKVLTIPTRKANYYSYLPIGFILLCGIFTLSAKETDRFASGKSQKNIAVTSNSRQEFKLIDSTSEVETSADSAINIEDNQAVLNQNITEKENFDDPSLSIISDDTYGGEWARAEQEFENPQEKKKSSNPTQSDQIVIDNDNYTNILGDIEQNPQRYMGKKVVIEGFIYRDPQFAANEFVLARMYMICCAADVQITGLMCRWDESAALDDEQWLHVEGVLEMVDYEMYGDKTLMPMIQVSTAQTMPTPENQYIYY